MRTYRKIIEIKFEHKFYDNAQINTNDLEIEPTHNTQVTFENYRLFTKQKANTINIIQECEQNEKSTLPIIEIEKELNFNFIIKQKNNQFINFTDIPFLEMRHNILYFSNKKNNKITADEFLSKKELVSEEDTISIVGKKEYFLITNKSKASAGVIGYINFFTNGNYIENIKNEIASPYSISFNSRPTYWRYHIREKYNSVAKIKIIDEQEKISFQKENGKTEKEKTFLTKEKISIKKNNKQIFKLISANGNKNFNKILYEKLPYPKINHISKHETLENEYISNIYVYI